ncbi:hypothetical protein JMJ77_0012370 [Colletotrichum scovillei]|uniref:Uncharacterized protein n=1 Tax=Colletotrichum scovillei TaxID=1209932 RepID=A0A9P7QS62_9PEZI|nr:hypothetical protein JMJ78_0001423 [Colletotrichum scovillei]KAG7041854.1 hypothetical protein JMJ77_0012370 [Colletotrichum scovillei]KAG7061884.1 hypothetical protein JMJ76_0003838 [Colletotrichum scovillei]
MGSDCRVSNFLARRAGNSIIRGPSTETATRRPRRVRISRYGARVFRRPGKEFSHTFDPGKSESP